MRAINQLQTTVLPVNLAAFRPFLSPDGAWIAFYDQSDGTLKKMSINGGPAISICFVGPALPRGASWGEDGTIVFATSDPATGLFRVAAGGGEPMTLTTPDSGKGESVDDVWPHFLPGGHALVFTRSLSRRSEIVLLNLDTMEQRGLIPEGNAARYAASGHLVYGVNGTLRAVAFDLGSRTVKGNPVPVLEDVLTPNDGWADFSIAGNGSLVYFTGAAAVEKERPVWVSRDGHEEGALVEADLLAPRYPRLSPAGTKLALVDDGEVWSTMSADCRRSK